jgi:oligosaccharyltransferase complex subunit epsilon
MAPKRNVRDVTPSTVSHTQASTTTAGSTPVSTKAPSKSISNQSPADIALGIWQKYLDDTPQRTKLIDVFMAFLVTVGVLQFVYCVIAGNYVRCARDTFEDGC